MLAHEPAEGDRAVVLHDLLIALGYHAHERVSICTQLPGGRFESELHPVASLAGWTPPQDRNVWFGVNPVGRHVRYGRGTEADITRVRALFADLDLKLGQFSMLWQCYEAELIMTGILGIDPVALIESGHGLQPIWRISSPRGDSNVVDRDRSRDGWKVIYQRWGAVVQQAARDACFMQHMCVDNVFNLDRILRCPGSVNWKRPDKPVPVRTKLFGHGAHIRPRHLVTGMDRDNIAPLAAVRTRVAGVPTDFGEAKEWIDAQPGATTELAELQQMPLHATLHEYADPWALVPVLDGPNGAHRTMIAKVLHAVYAAQEGRAGLVVALHNICVAYLEVMERRASGELTGDVRDAATATIEWQSAVRGAVAKARGRKVPRKPRCGLYPPPAPYYPPRAPRAPKVGRYV